MDNKIIRLTSDRKWWDEDREPSQSIVVTKEKRKLPKKLFKVSEVAQILGATIYLVYDLIHQRQIDFQPVGKRGFRISEDALLDYLERRKREALSKRRA